MRLLQRLAIGRDHRDQSVDVTRLGFELQAARRARATGAAPIGGAQEPAQQPGFLPVVECAQRGDHNIPIDQGGAQCAA